MHSFIVTRFPPVMMICSRKIRQSLTTIVCSWYKNGSKNIWLTSKYSIGSWFKFLSIMHTYTFLNKFSADITNSCYCQAWDVQKLQHFSNFLVLWFTKLYNCLVKKISCLFKVINVKWTQTTSAEMCILWRDSLFVL